MKTRSPENKNYLVFGFGLGFAFTAILKPILAGIHIYNALPNGAEYITENYGSMLGNNLGQFTFGLILSIKLPFMRNSLSHIMADNSSPETLKTDRMFLKLLWGFWLGQ